MRVARLEVFGFKSFMERLTLPLEAGVTGVVGPNGCGKSNIIDALRWVLGETRASNLRGGVLEDVIFNGTDKLRPLGLAEVTITLRASAADFFSDLVSPSLEADLIASLNLPAAPVDDVVEVPESKEGTEEHRPHLTVIEGRLGTAAEAEEQAVSALDGLTPSVGELGVSKTEETSSSADVSEGAVSPTEVAEDGAAPSVAAEEKLDEDDPKRDVTMLTRFAWLKSVSEVQVTRRLYRSGESEFFINRVSCRLKDVKEFFRAVGIGARAYTIVAQGEVTRIISARPEERRLILEEAAGVLGFRDRISAATRRLDDTSVNVSRLEDVIKEVTRQVNSLRVQASRAKNRQSLKDQICSLDRQLFRDTYLEFEVRKGAATQALQQFQEKEAHLDAAAQKVHAEEQEVRGELMRIDLEADSFRSKIDSLREELERRAQQRNKYTSRINELRAFALARGTEISRLEEQLGTFENRQSESQAEVQQLLAREVELQQALSALGQDNSDELREISRRRDELRGNLRDQEQVIRELRDRLISAQSSIKALEEQIVASSPLNQLKQTTQPRDLEELRSVASDTSLFAEGLSVPGEYIRAVQSLLAERAKFLVSKDPEKIARYFVENSTQRKEKMAGIGVFRAGSAVVARAPNDTIGLPRLLDLITVNDSCSLAASRIFADVYVVPSTEEAFAFFAARSLEESSVLAATLVTLDGEIITAFSFFSLRHEGGLIHLKSRVDALMAECAEFEEKHQQAAAERERLQQEIRVAEERHTQVLKEIQDRQARARDLHNQIGNVRGRIQAVQRLTQQAVQDLTRVHRQIDESRQRVQEYHEEEQKLQAEIQQLVPDADAPLHEELRNIKQEYEKVEQVRREGRSRLSDVAHQVEEARRALDAVRTNSSKFLLEVQKVELECQNLFVKVRNEYGDEMLAVVVSEEATARLLAEQKSEFEAEVSRLRTRVMREGDVDPSSIARFEEEDARLKDLTKQKQDLETAALTLKRTITRLTETSERRFVATFNAVRENFARLVPRLFGGGRGQIELMDPQHPLESGVDIMVRPPGKKPKSIELLSGGEKALCATALIFAMFLERPSPLCVLDEVDAPLDEANLLRFVNLIKEMSTKTQFLVITHNKSTMAIADHLVGVTQEEPGASKIIAVSLQDAFSQVA